MDKMKPNKEVCWKCFKDDELIRLNFNVGAYLNKFFEYRWERFLDGKFWCPLFPHGRIYPCPYHMEHIINEVK